MDGLSDDGPIDALFVSDIHLSAEEPQTAHAFETFLGDARSRAVHSVYILGDLFEYWAGDEDLELPFAARVCAWLEALTEQGVALFVMHGNRDVLLSDAFARATGATLIADPTEILVGDGSLVLSHGDALCTDDHDYQRLRALVRDPTWQHNFLARPVAERRTFIGSLREQSIAATRMKAAEIMDVNDGAVRELFAATQSKCLIHGHTHRPALHHLQVSGRNCQRWVLPDWDARSDSVRGGGLALQHGVLTPIGPWSATVGRAHR
jgi:UDP-2,3-diacylglucosamine hydrolase